MIKQRSKPEQWHKRLAKITGELSLRIERRNLSKAEVLDWTKELNAITAEMNEKVKS